MADGGVPVEIGTGTTLTLGGTTFEALQLTDVQWGGITRESLQTSHMGTVKANDFGGHTFMPGDLADCGEITCTFHFDPDETPPINVAANTIQITWPLTVTDQSAANWAASDCFMTSFEINDPLEDVMTATGTWKIQGNVTITGSVAAV
jgi:hypothetical protein